MNYLHVFLSLFICLSVSAQSDQLLISKRLVEDWSTTPIYSRLIEKDGEKEVFKQRYKYLDSIEVYAITYLSDGLKVKGFMVKPKEKGNYPCIIYNRGGNRNMGALRLAHGALTLGEIAKEGYVVIASQYRGNAGSEGKEEFGGADINDVLVLPDVLAEVESADTSRIGMYGWSRGGMMTYMALTQTSKVKVAAVGGANTDLTLIDRPMMETRVYAELIPNYAMAKEVELKKRSAIYWADKFSTKVPVLLLHGNADWRVKSTNALKLALEFEKYRIPYRLKIFEGGDHGIREFKGEVTQEVLRWFDTYLKNGEALPNMSYHGK